MKDTKTPFAEHDGIFYVRLDAVMNPYVAMFDSLPLTYFGESSKPGPAYLTLDTAIQWCKREVVHALDKEKYNVMISVMERAKEQEHLEARSPACAAGKSSSTV